MDYQFAMIEVKSRKVIYLATDFEIFRKSVPDIKKGLDNERKINAHSLIAHAVNDGILPNAKTLGCYKCGKWAKYWHHPLGYQDHCIYVVIPVCRVCHMKIHWDERKSQK